MMVFAFDEDIKRQQKKILSKIRRLKSGETAHMLSKSGIKYKKIYGVSLVHLRELAQGFNSDNRLAELLWFQEIRETMILATMLAERELLSEKQLNEWADKITNIELAEQVAFNLLGKRSNDIIPILESWLFHTEMYVRYSALMSIGWSFRFTNQELGNFVKENFILLEALASEPLLTRAISHCLKMMGRFNPALQNSIVKLALKWQNNHEPQLKVIGDNVLMEIKTEFN